MIIGARGLAARPLAARAFHVHRTPRRAAPRHVHRRRQRTARARSRRSRRTGSGSSTGWAAAPASASCCSRRSTTARVAVLALALFAFFTAISMALLSTGFGMTLSSGPARARSFNRLAPALGAAQPALRRLVRARRAPGRSLRLLTCTTRPPAIVLDALDARRGARLRAPPDALPGLRGRARAAPHRGRRARLRRRAAAAARRELRRRVVEVDAVVLRGQATGRPARLGRGRRSLPARPSPVCGFASRSRRVTHADAQRPALRRGRRSPRGKVVRDLVHRATGCATARPGSRHGRPRTGRATAPFRAGAAVAVTLEPGGGSRAPTGPLILRTETA